MIFSVKIFFEEHRISDKRPARRISSRRSLLPTLVRPMAGIRTRGRITNRNPTPVLPQGLWGDSIVQGTESDTRLRPAREPGPVGPAALNRAQYEAVHDNIMITPDFMDFCRVSLPPRTECKTESSKHEKSNPHTGIAIP